MNSGGKTFSHLSWFCIALFLLANQSGFAQRRAKKAEATPTYDSAYYNGLEWRSIGPYRGGRSAAVTGVPGKPNLFYFGAAGGGVWRTTDGGSNWQNISDGYFGGSIGSVAVSKWDPNVLYVGGGEKTVRGNMSSGSGMWKSTDAGKTWQHMGLKESRHISRIAIHPKNPDLVYAAVMGDVYKPTQQRGVYRSKDGGRSWEQVLFVNTEAGAVDLIMDPNNSRNLYATTWNIQRTPYSLISGGEGSALWKSTDGGDSWQNISSNKGLPGGTWGISGITVSPANSNRLYAIIENEKGGVFRSDDAGDTWTRTNDERSLRQRAWYYTRIYADPKEEDKVYVLNVNYHVSKDGGKNFTSHAAPHGDHHDLWIAPEDPQRMIIGDDGGAQVSFDGGDNWSTYHNQPTAQFYRVTTDNHFPYRIYGAQQDNSTVRINHRSGGYGIGEKDWEETAGGESAHIAVDPENNDIVYGGSYGGYLSRVDHSSGQVRLINVWPDNPMGYGAKDLKYRFQWNFPVFFSPHNPDKLYAASNHLHVTTDEGESWEEISPDLTRDDTTKMGPSGGPITKDNTSVEYYGTIFAAAESPYEEGLLWTGSDDGLIHVSRDGGKNWQNVTPENMPEWVMINSVEPHPFKKGGLYVAGTRYKLGDFEPYLYKTEDYGKSWTKITKGIPAEHFTRVVRADPAREGLLYAGTENGMYISFDDGANWQPFQLNLPIVPITDLAIKNNNLIAATQGRSFWLIDDLSPLHQLKSEVTTADFYLYEPLDAYRMAGRQSKRARNMGQNHPGGVLFYTHFKEKPDSSQLVRFEVLEEDGTLIKQWSSQAETEDEKLEIEKGMQRLRWDMQYPDAEKFEGLILWGGGTSGPEAVPGTYKARLSVGDQQQEVDFTILKDPRSAASQEDMEAQFRFIQEVQAKLSETHKAIKDMREARSQMQLVQQRAKGTAEGEVISQMADSINQQISHIEEALYQTKNRSGQDPLNFPIRLNNKLANLASQASVGYYRPTQQLYAFKEEVTGKIDEQLSQWQQIKEREIPAFNRLVKESAVDAVRLPESPVEG